jgi:hypothetical protein
MSKILISAVPLAGHANPTLVIAEFLRNSGQDKPTCTKTPGDKSWTSETNNKSALGYG